MPASESGEERLPRIGPAVLAYVAAVFAAIAAWLAFDLSGAALVAVAAIPAAALVWMIRQCRARARAAGPASKAAKAYVRRFIPMILAYVLVLVGVVWLHRQFAPSGPAAVALAILPALPLLGVIWAIGRLLIEEKDEYQRSLHVRQFIVATGFMLAVTSVWGFLEQFGQVPHLPMYWAFIVWCAGLGVGSIANEIRV